MYSIVYIGTGVSCSGLSCGWSPMFSVGAEGAKVESGKTDIVVEKMPVASKPLMAFWGLAALSHAFFNNLGQLAWFHTDSAMRSLHAVL